MAALVNDAHTAGVDLLAAGVSLSELPGVESQRVASRYFLDNSSDMPDEQTHEELLRDIYAASLRDLRVDWGWSLDKSSELAKRLGKDDNDASFTAKEDPQLALLAEIRDLLRDRLPAHPA